MLEVLPENPALIFLLDSEHKRGGIGVSSICGVVGLGPGELGAEEGVVNGLVGVEVEVDVGGLGAGEEVSEIGVLDGREGIEVGEDFPVKLIFLEMVVVERDLEGLVDVEAVFEGVPPFVQDLERRGLAEEAEDEEGGKDDEEKGGDGGSPRPRPKLHVGLYWIGIASVRSDKNCGCGEE